MAKCKYQQICYRDAEDEEGLCILHSQGSKSAKAFEDALEAHFRSDNHDFSHFVFPTLLDFSKRKFLEPNFSDAVFRDLVGFIGAEFKQEVYFSRATFDRGVNFDKAVFEGCDFSYAIFGKDAVFDGAKLKLANFCGARFKGNASFSHVAFCKEAKFIDARFNRETDFYDAQFGDVARFPLVKFEGEANFEATMFADRSWFDGATFNKGADFRGATFVKQASFRGAAFRGRSLFAPGTDGCQDLVFSDAEIDFREAIIDPLNALTIRDADLRKCKFQGTDLRKVEITGAKWSKIPIYLPCTRVKLGTRDGVYDDEIALLQESQNRKAMLLESSSWPHIEQIYRQLKQNAEERRDYERASDFHYGEKEALWKNRETSPGLKFLLCLYWAVSGYGEKWLPPLVWIFILFVLSTLGYFMWGLTLKPECAAAATTNVLEYLNYSLRVMTLLKPDDLVPMGCAKYINTAESLLGPVLIGLFALALRQRLKR